MNNNQPSGCGCGPLAYLFAFVCIVLAIIFVAPQTPTDKPAPQWYQSIENVLQSGGQQIQQRIPKTGTIYTQSNGEPITMSW